MITFSARVHAALKGWRDAFRPRPKMSSEARLYARAQARSHRKEMKLERRLLSAKAELEDLSHHIAMTEARYARARKEADDLDRRMRNPESASAVFSADTPNVRDPRSASAWWKLAPSRD
jgi:hypothetical protein